MPASAGVARSHESPGSAQLLAAWAGAASSSPHASTARTAPALLTARTLRLLAAKIPARTTEGRRLGSAAMPDPQTPLKPAPPRLAAGLQLFLKREDVHELGAFKWRGALPVLEQYREGGAEAVVTASTGNHGAATAWAAQRN